MIEMNKKIKYSNCAEGFCDRIFIFACI